MIKRPSALKHVRDIYVEENKTLVLRKPDFASISRVVSSPFRGLLLFMAVQLA